MSAMVSALGSLKAPWVETSEIVSLMIRQISRVPFGKICLEKIYVYIIFIGRDTQKWFFFQ